MAIVIFVVSYNKFVTILVSQTASMDFKYISSQKSRKKLYCGGFFYFMCNKTDSAVYWRCEQWKKGCKARANVNRDSVITLTGCHIHDGNPAKLEVTEAVNAMKHLATTKRDAPRSIIASVAASLSKESSALLPSVSSISRSIRHTRAKDSSVGMSVPLSLLDLVIPAQYQKTCKGEKFVLFDSLDEERVIVFGTERNLGLLANCTLWLMDGTFKIVPQLFYQLYSIHGKVRDNYFPLVYGLLPKKTEAVYRKFFQEVRKHIEHPKVEIIVTDFELAAIHASSLLFPKSINRGCYFHYRQCIRRYLQHSGLQGEYDSDIDFNQFVKTIIAVAFVPVEYVSRAFEAVCARDHVPEQAQALIGYFEQTWVGRKTPRLAPKYAHTLWNFYTATVEEYPITNNAVESWHRSLENQFHAKNPSIWSFLEGLLREQAINELKITQQDAGSEAPPRKKYKDKNKRLQTVVGRFVAEFQDTTEYFNSYLQNVAYNL